MKNLLLACCLICLFLHTKAQEPINIMTFNIRLDVVSDSLNSWQYRKEKVASQVLFHETDILAVQEALHNQILDLQQSLKEYKYTGVGRENGKTRGEYSAIFYKTKRFELLKEATFWLSETPEISGSKSWDAAITRIVSWAKFRDRMTKKTFFVFNTHFDHIGKIARNESAKLLLKAVDSLAGRSIAILTGDLNAHPKDEPIKIITDKNNPIHLTDTKEVSLTPHYGPTGTFNGFGTKERNDDPIDYIYFNRGVKVLQHGTLSQSWQGRFSSDHFPVWVKVLL